MYEPLLAMGFEILQAFEEITNSPDTVSCVRYSFNLVGAN